MIFFLGEKSSLSIVLRSDDAYAINIDFLLAILLKSIEAAFLRAIKKPGSEDP